MIKRTRDPLTGAHTYTVVRGNHRHRALAAYAAEGRPRYKNTGAPMTAAQKAQAIAQADAQATALILARASPMFQLMPVSQAIGGNNVVQGNTYNFNLVNVGLNRRVIIEVSGTIAHAAAETLTATPWGILNLISNVQLTDLSNFQRINTKPRHLFVGACARKRGVAGAAYTVSSPAGVGNNMNVMYAPSSVTTAQSFRFFIELPLSYTPTDLRGAVWANVTGGNWRVQLTFNQNAVVGSGTTDHSEAAYYSSTAGDVGIISNINVNIYQDYLDQLPQNRDGSFVLPTASLAYNYLWLWAPQYGIVANTEYGVQYTNFRTFLSTYFEYDNAGTLNAGTDINYFAIQVANQANIFKSDVYTAGLQTRDLIGDDFPAGCYYLDHRAKPIITNNVGNTQLVVNAATAGAGSYLSVFWEMLSVQNQALNATSLPVS